MKMLRNFAVGLSILGLASCGEAPERAITADAAWIGGAVLTMNTDNDTASAVAIKDGRIIAVGTDSEVMATVGDDTALTDLNGKTMLPGFIDAHGHFPMAGDSALTQVAIQSPPVGTINSIPELLEALRAKAAETPKGEWVFGMGYDDTLLAEKRHPTKEELDSVSTDHPVFAMHVSLHMGVANTALQALRATTIDAAWQSFLEEDRGSLEAGKRADLVILAENPLDRPETMDDITVLETIVGGNTVYLNDNAEQNNE